MQALSGEVLMINERLTNEELESLSLAMKSHLEVMAESGSEAEIIECSQIVRALRELQERRNGQRAGVSVRFCHVDASGELQWQDMKCLRLRILPAKSCLRFVEPSKRALERLALIRPLLWP
ncbi:TPA: hypothetical protein OME29_004132 [Klebsiella oxytoca]|nr:hypothetical protein [Klebsiella oxytoca]